MARDETQAVLESLIKEGRLIRALRQRLDLMDDDVPNSWILESTKGTFLRSQVELRLAVEDVGRVIHNALQGFLISVGRAFRRRK